MTLDIEPWFAAIRAGDLATVDRLLASTPALLMARDANGVSSLTWSCYVRQHAVRDRLLAARPELDVFEAAAAGDEASVARRIAADSTLAKAFSPDGFTALHLAAFFGHAAIASGLLMVGADPKAVARNATIVQPLHSAAAAGQLDIARLLLERGADPNARQVQGFTALMSAAQQGHVAMAELLLAHGADPSLAAEDGHTPADFAAEKGHEALAAKLRGVTT
jgi:ankyrin repeat protein